MNVETPAWDEATAHREFADLTREQAATCLWFIRKPGNLTLADPAADMALRAIVRHGTRTAWRRAKELQAWRSQHSR